MEPAQATDPSVAYSVAVADHHVAASARRTTRAAESVGASPEDASPGPFDCDAATAPDNLNAGP